jgi:hypothetical protein
MAAEPEESIINEIPIENLKNENFPVAADVEPRDLSTSSAPDVGDLPFKEEPIANEIIPQTNTSSLEAVVVAAVIPAHIPKEVEEAEVAQVLEQPNASSQAVDYEKLLIRFKKSVAISNFDQDLLSEDHLILIKTFLLEPESRKLVMYMDEHSRPAVLCVSSSLPSQAFNEMAYFIKESLPIGATLTYSNFEKKVQYGKLTTNIMVLACIVTKGIPLKDHVTCLRSYISRKQKVARQCQKRV